MFEVGPREKNHLPTTRTGFLRLTRWNDWNLRVIRSAVWALVRHASYLNKLAASPVVAPWSTTNHADSIAASIGRQGICSPNILHDWLADLCESTFSITSGNPSTSRGRCDTGIGHRSETDLHQEWRAERREASGFAAGSLNPVPHGTRLAVSQFEVWPPEGNRPPVKRFGTARITGETLLP
jgi:hypothetical protein